MPDSPFPGMNDSQVRLGRPARRRALLSLCIAALTPCALLAQRQQSRPSRRIGVLTNAWAADHPTVQGLKAGLRELGLQQGRDVTFNVQFTQGRPEAASEQARALLAGGLDALFAVGSASALAAKATTPSVPVVFAQVGDPVAIGLVPDLARPGGHVTGVSSIAAELMPKRIEILKTLVPGLQRVWIVAPADDSTRRVAASGLRDAAGLLGVEVEGAEIAAVDDLARLRGRLKHGDGLLAPNIDALELAAAALRLSLDARVPAIFPSSLWVGYGGLASYGPDFYALGNQAARLMVKVLAGAPPGALPIERADVLDLALNLGTASAMSINVPRKILLRARTIRR